MNADFGDVSIIVSKREAEKIWDKFDDVDEVDAAQQAKLDTIEEGAEVNVQSDYAEEDTTDDDYIKNKPVGMDSEEIQAIVDSLN